MGEVVSISNHKDFKYNRPISPGTENEGILGCHCGSNTFFITSYDNSSRKGRVHCSNCRRLINSLGVVIEDSTSEPS